MILVRFEIVVCLSGSSRETGQLSEDRTSYLPKEILWGHRFKEIVKYDNEEGAYVADYNRFDETEVIDTPLCSAMELNNGLQQSSETQPEVNLNKKIFKLYFLHKFFLFLVSQHFINIYHTETY